MSGFSVGYVLQRILLRRNANVRAQEQICGRKNKKSLLGFGAEEAYALCGIVYLCSVSSFCLKGMGYVLSHTSGFRSESLSPSTYASMSLPFMSGVSGT